MPAKIAVVDGPGKGKVHWVESSVVRIGSHPQSDLLIPDPDLPHHAATIEFRNGEYHAHNRCDTEVMVEGIAVCPNEYGIWENAGELVLPAGVRLVLEIDGDGAPCPRPSEIDAAYEEEIQHCKEEGVAYHFLVSPEKLLIENGKAVGAVFRKNIMGDFTKWGRRKPEPILLFLLWA